MMRAFFIFVGKMNNMHDDLKNALEILRTGGVILFPADTSWCLGCDAADEKAVDKLLEIMGQRSPNSEVILLDQIGRIDGYIDDVPSMAYDMLEMSDKPLVLVLEGAKNLAHNVVDDKENTIAVQVSTDRFCQQLIQRFKKPIFSVPATVNQTKLNTIFDDVDEDMLSKVNYIVEHRQDDIRKIKPSGIVLLRKSGEVKVIRE
jgi:L-threonylcarbamoyladenylate synthase